MRKRKFTAVMLFTLAMFPLHIQAQNAAPAATATQPAAEKSFQEKIFQEVVKAPLIMPRSQDDIKADMESAKQEGAAADKKTAAVQEGLNKASQLLQQQKGEMDSLKKKTDLAKKEKRETDKITLEAEKKKAEAKARKEQEAAQAKIATERKEKERLAEMLKNQIECPKCGHKFQLKK